jgi:hypothetical protein
MLIIASRRSRKRSFLPEEGRVGRIAKTPENRASEPDFLQFPILQSPWESLKTKEFSDFSGRTTYYQYTSLFHSGRLSPSDNKFLIQIRSFNNPDPDFQIDNPKEVVAAMRDEDFSRNYVLNVEIVDCLLSDPLLYAAPTKKLLEFIASDFDDCADFFATYYVRGRGVPTLITRVTRSWPGFVTAAIESSANLTHVARIITHLPETNLKSIAGKNRALAEFVSEKLPDILALGIDFPPERLELLGIEATDLSAIERHPGFIRVIFDRGLYELSIENLDFIFRTVLDINADARPREQSYTVMLEADSAPLLAKVNDHFGNYLENVLLRLPDNRFESIPAILSVIGRGDVDLEPVVAFLEKQTILLPTLDQVCWFPRGSEPVRRIISIEN